MKSGDIATYKSSFPRVFSATGESSIFVYPGSIVLLVKKNFDDWYVLYGEHFGLISSRLLTAVKNEPQVKMH